jgi:hypothetical protein
MTISKFATAVALSLVLSGLLNAAGTDSAVAGQRPTLAPLVADDDGFVYVASSDDGQASESPSDMPPPAPVPDDVKAAPPKPDEEPADSDPPGDVPGRSYDPAYDTAGACDARAACGECGSSGCYSSACGTPSRGFQLGGWIDQGISFVANRPADRYNGPVIFNDRDGEYQMNQLWLYAEREVDTGGCGWDVGGRIDFVYGTDARFTQAVDGLEANWNQTEPFYQAALPQFYLDVGYNDWLIRVGHFYTIIGYEVVQAPDNFFYSHAYAMQYGEPLTHTGILLNRDIGPQWSFTAGLHRGNDQFDDTDGLNAMNYLGGVTWTNCAESFSAAFAISCTEQGPGVNQMIYSVVGTWNVTDRLTYVIQHDLGETFDPAMGTRAEWYGLNQYFLYQINDCWSAGLRAEWFRDDDGVRVMGLGVGNQNQGQPQAPPHFVGDFYEITAGLNWTPTCSLTVRPEVRWDWFDSDLPTPPGTRPYDAGDRGGQFLFGCDLIYTF